MECTCGTKIGTCKHDDGAVLVTWRDQHGEMHVNGTGVVIEEMTPDLTGAPDWTTRVRGGGTR